MQDTIILCKYVKYVKLIDFTIIIDNENNLTKHNSIH